MMPCARQQASLSLKKLARYVCNVLRSELTVFNPSLPCPTHPPQWWWMCSQASSLLGRDQHCCCCYCLMRRPQSGLIGQHWHQHQYAGGCAPLGLTHHLLLWPARMGHQIAKCITSLYQTHGWKHRSKWKACLQGIRLLCNASHPAAMRKGSLVTGCGKLRFKNHSGSCKATPACT